MKKFAETTKTSVARSKMEIEELIYKYAGNDTEFTSGQSMGQAAINFVAKGRRVLFRLPLPTKEEAAANAKRRYGTDDDEIRFNQWIDQETRRRWRCLLLKIKAKLESVESGISTFDEEFLANIVLSKTGDTVYQAIKGMSGGPLMLESVK